VLARPEYGIAVVLALAPLTNLRVGASGTKPFQVLLPALVVGLLVYGALVVRGQRRVAPPLPLAVLLFAAAGVAASVQGFDPHTSEKKLFLLLTATVLFFAVLEICRTRAQLAVVAGGALAGMLIASLQGIEQHFRHNTSVGFLVGGHYVGRVQGSFGHPNQYGGYLAFLVPLAVAVLLSRAFSPRLRWLAAAALAASVPALSYSYARGAILALVVGGVVWLALLRPRYAIGAAVVVAVAGVLLAPAALRERFNTQAASGDVPLRSDIWGAAVDIYTSHPLLGVGLGNFAAAYSQLPSTLAHATQRRLLNQSGLIIPPHAQNMYLNTMAEEGVIGTAALVFLFLAALVTAWRAARARAPDAVAIGMAVGAGMLVLAVHSILEVTLLTELSLPLFALLAATARYSALEAEEPADVERPDEEPEPLPAAA
jgi:O-antigen ligase